MTRSSTTKYHPLAWLLSLLSAPPCTSLESTVAYMRLGQFSPSMSM